MNLADLVEKVATADTKLTKAQAKELVEGVFTAIREAAISGEEVALAGFGKFKIQHKPARTGRNPRSGEPVAIAATRKVVFQPAKALKDALAV